MNIDFLKVFFVDFLSVIVKCMICFDKFPILLPGFILLYLCFVPPQKGGMYLLVFFFSVLASVVAYYIRK